MCIYVCVWCGLGAVDKQDDRQTNHPTMSLLCMNTWGKYESTLHTASPALKGGQATVKEYLTNLFCHFQ